MHDNFKLRWYFVLDEPQQLAFKPDAEVRPGYIRFWPGQGVLCQTVGPAGLRHPRVPVRTTEYRLSPVVNIRCPGLALVIPGLAAGGADSPRAYEGLGQVS